MFNCFQPPQIIKPEQTVSEKGPAHDAQYLLILLHDLARPNGTATILLRVVKVFL